MSVMEDHGERTEFSKVCRPKHSLPPSCSLLQTSSLYDFPGFIHSMLGY